MAPFRTFPEVAQPESAFVFRLQQTKAGEELKAQAALFEADGGAWRVQAIAAVKAWLRGKLPDAVIIA